MYALAYLVVAIVSATLATRAWLADRREPARRRFFVLGWNLALTYVFFALSLSPDLQSVRLAYMALGPLIPVTGLWTIEQIFASDDIQKDGWVTRLFATSALVVPTLLLFHIMTASTFASTTRAATLLGGYTFLSFIVMLLRLYIAWQHAPMDVERRRRAYLMALISAGVIATAAEQLTRTLDLPLDHLTPQGPVPPVSAILAGLSIYLLHHTVTWSRLLEVNELFSLVARVIIFALLLVGMDAVALMGHELDQPAHVLFQLLFASVLFIAAYEPLREPLRWFSDRLFNQRGQELSTSLHDLRSRIPRMIDADRLVSVILEGLVGSGRCPTASVYLWDSARNTFLLMDAKGHGDAPPLRVISAEPFTSGFSDGARYYSRPLLRRQAQHDERRDEILKLMDTVQADLAVPFMRRDIVLGWVLMRDSSWSDGYSADEIGRIIRLANLAAITLSNIRDFEVLEEKHRLAALGAMATGLAHEIRNPLAGVKGATQYLEEESLPIESKEMLQVIIHEVDRLDTVVRRFLDYARPFELQREDEQINALVTHVLTLLQAEGLPEGILMEQRLGGDLPPVSVDGPRIQQVLFNLLRNAIQAMPEGGTLTVSTRALTPSWTGTYLEIAIADTGTGISPHDLENLFVPFFTTKSDGTGLGLSICQRIAEAHGGELEARSKQDEGSTFMLRLPSNKAGDLKAV